MEWNENVSKPKDIILQRHADETEIIRSHFNSTQREILGATDVMSELKSAFAQILLRVDEFLDNGSNWTIHEMSHLDIHIARYQALRGGSTFVNLPVKLRSKGAIINIRNNDQKCFMWSVLSALDPVEKDGQKTWQYSRYQNELNFDGMGFPVKIKDIARFEHINNIGISIFGWEEEEVLSLRICKESYAKIIDSMLIDGHYCWIKNLDVLLSDQWKHNGKKYSCRRCIIPQYSVQKLLIHYEGCRQSEPTRTVMPETNCLKFTNYNRAQRPPYVIYCDFEALLLNMDLCSLSSSMSYTTKYQQHHLCSFGLVDVFGCCQDRMEIGDYFSYRGDNAVQIFLQQIIELTEKHQSRELHLKPRLSNDEWKAFAEASQCYLCDGNFLQNEKVRDHCHYCSRYRGAAHYDCNVSYRLQNKVQVVFHNLKKYDGHLIMQEIGSLCYMHGLQLNCIAKGMEDYISFSLTKQTSHKQSSKKRKLTQASAFILDEASDDDTNSLLDYETEMQMDNCPQRAGMRHWQIVFIDSLLILPSSLDVLVKNMLAQGNDSFVAMSHNFPNNTQMLLRKGIYPYEYMDSWRRFSDPTLPTIKKFYSSLTDSTPSVEDYAHANNVCNTFKLTTTIQADHIQADLVSTTTST